MKRYSKPVYQGRRLRRMVELAEKSAEMPAGEATSLPQAQRVDRRLSPETIAELVQAYRDGASTTELRRHYELSQGSVIKLLHEHSVAMRNQGLVGGDVATATELYQSGATSGAARRTIQRPKDGIGGWGPSHGVSGLCVSVAFELDCQLRQFLRIEVPPLTVVPHGFQRSA
jgi:hypothetical protein